MAGRLWVSGGQEKELSQDGPEWRKSCMSKVVLSNAYPSRLWQCSQEKNTSLGVKQKDLGERHISWYVHPRLCQCDFLRASASDGRAMAMAQDEPWPAT